MTPDVVVERCALGRGLFATRPFAPRERILGFHGERMGRTDPIHQTDKGANLLQTGWRTYILLESPGVFANHSCDPNAGVWHNRFLIAIRPIAAGEEICFDYSTTMAENYWTMTCRCGSPRCRGVVADFDRLPEPVQERYLAMDIVQGFIAASHRRHREGKLAAAAGCDMLLLPAVDRPD